jgi:hypothetical protein
MLAKALSDAQASALHYVCEHPGCTTAEVARGTGLLLPAHAQRALDALYTKRLLGRQHNLLGMKVALWWPEAVALDAHRRAQEAKT